MTQEKLKNKLLGFADSVAESNGTCISDIVDFWSEYIYKELPHWISVEDELPEQNRWVLTYNGSSINLLMLASNGGWYDHSVAKHRNITHWMPLPAPPKNG